ncbi:MAG: hypothetical protein KF767_08740 [Bdellovibrionaceae bacterium]|nr:hypothetical protein [Pseudobdellovibrionaceae bacterium]
MTTILPVKQTIRRGWQAQKIAQLEKENAELKKRAEDLQTQVTVKLTMLIGACRIPSIKKKQIEESLERFIEDLKKQKKQPPR